MVSRSKEILDASKVSLILPTFNGLSYTRSLLDSLSDSYIKYIQLIIINDASTDGTREYLEALKIPNLQIVHNSSNLGYASSCNLGASIADYERLCFLNNDLILAGDWLEPLVSGLSLPDAGLVGCVQTNPSTNLIDHVGMYFDVKGMPRHAGHKFKRPPSDSYIEWSAVTAACFAIRKSVFDQADRFDTSYRNGYEDVDLCLRLSLKGYRHYVANHSRIFHHVSKSPGRKLHEDRNAKIFIERWGEHTRQLGRREWPMEYLRICRNRPSKIRLGQLFKALWLLLAIGSPAGI